jgi:hypothetical protein
MLEFMLTVSGALSILAMIRSVFLAEDYLFEAVAIGIFGFISFILTALLTNLVLP